MNVLVIEYERGVADKIRQLLYELDESIQVTGVTGDAFAAGEWLHGNAIPDLILANEGTIVNMGGRYHPGIRALVTLSTQDAQYNFQAFRYKAVRHLLDRLPSVDERPVSFDQLLNEATRQPGLANYKERFLVKQGQRLLSIPVQQIAYFFSQERFIFLRTVDNQKYLLEYRIEQLESLLEPARFFRINRSLIVSLPSVKEIHSYFGNRLKLFLHPSFEREVIVSRKRVSYFKEWLGK
ncbi:MAG: LytR/AlgR family response regulator transcription factor [Chitinophagaceae bacterium]